MAYPLYEYGGSGPLLHMALANGFPPESYKALLDPFTDRYRVICLKPRPLWNPAPNPENLKTWRTLADDLTAGLREHKLMDVILVGHSLGGVVSTLAAIAEPDRVRALVLLDPTFLRPAFLRIIALMRPLGLSSRYPLVKQALRRRGYFISPEEAFAYWRQKPLFADWADETLRDYVEGALRQTHGGGHELTWSPRWESQVFRAVITDGWREPRRLRPDLPVLVIRGENTNAYVRACERKMRRLLPHATHLTMAGYGHLFPHAAPKQTAQIIDEWLTGQTD